MVDHFSRDTHENLIALLNNLLQIEENMAQDDGYDSIETHTTESD